MFCPIFISTLVDQGYAECPKCCVLIFIYPRRVAKGTLVSRFILSVPNVVSDFHISTSVDQEYVVGVVVLPSVPNVLLYCHVG